MTREVLALILGVLLIVLALHVDAWPEHKSRERASCTTDTDCMRLCPAAEADCDGGPQS